MQVGITNPLRQFLRWRPFTPWPEEADLFYCWDAHRVKLDGRVMLVLTNAANRFTGVTAMRGYEWDYLEDKCKELIREAMLGSGFPPDAVRAYFAQAGAIEFGRTHGRRPVANMNKAVETLQWCECERDEQFQYFLMNIVNGEDMCRCATRDDYGSPVIWMAEDLAAHGIKPGGPYRSACGYFHYPREDADDVDGFLMKDMDLAELDALIAELERTAPEWEVAAMCDGVIAEDEHAAEVRETLDRFERCLLEERGLTKPRTEGCRVCGDPERVRLDGFNEERHYCLPCYNRLTELVIGAPRVTNDRATLAAFDESGKAVQFSVERILTPGGAEWTARETLRKSDPKLLEGYVGYEVSLFADPMDDQDEVLSALWTKAQQAVGNPSTHAHDNAMGVTPSNGAKVGGETRFANETGWGRIVMSGTGYCIVVDGQAYTGEQFLDLMSCYDGFDLNWKVTDRTDPLPES